MFIKIMRLVNNFGIKQNIKPIIGRWAVDYNINTINRKVDLSNEDHCGTCVSVPEQITVTRNKQQIYIHKSFDDKLTNN
jgi:hypothetical protein